MSKESTSNKIPLLIKISSIIWILFGLLLSIGMVLTGGRMMQNTHMGDGSTVMVFLLVFVLLIALFILYIGIQTFRGKTKDVLGNSLGIILIGSMFVYQAALKSDSVMIVFGSFIILSGMIALKARSEYKNFIDSQGLLVAK